MLFYKGKQMKVGDLVKWAGFSRSDIGFGIVVGHRITMNYRHPAQWHVSFGGKLLWVTRGSLEVFNESR